MTINDFMSLIDLGVRVKCERLQQRNDVLQFLVEIGYEISKDTRDYLENNPNEAWYMHPGKNPNSGNMTIWRGPHDEHDRDPIPYETVEKLISQHDMIPLDERDEEEFSVAFSELMTGGVT